MEEYTDQTKPVFPRVFADNVNADFTQSSATGYFTGSISF